MMDDDLIALYPEGEKDSQALYDKVRVPTVSSFR